MALRKDAIGRSEWNERMEKFCELYAADPECNAKRAAIRAGYNVEGAANKGYKLLRRDDIKKRVQELRVDVVEQFGLSPEHMTIKLLDLYNRCMTAVPVKVWDSELHDYVDSGEWQFDSRGAAKAAELLLKLTGAFDDRTVITTGIIIKEDYGEQLIIDNGQCTMANGQCAIDN